MKSHLRLITLIVFVLNLSLPAQAQENKYAMKEFIRSCTYGVLAGTLVGAATLAFTDKPGDNLNKVARGASLGLYAGIMLGVYVVYIVPGQIAEEEEAEIYGEGVEEYEEEGRFNWDAYPILGDEGVEGAAVNFQLTF